MRTKLFLLASALLSLHASMAQDSNTGADTSSVIVRKDPRLDALEKKQIATNVAYKKATTRTMRGYRLLVVNTNKRDEAIAAKTKVYTYFPELKAYLLYQTPYFKLKAGNFKTRDEAEKYRKNFLTLFPNGVYIISDVIEVKPEKDTNESASIK